MCLACMRRQLNWATFKVKFIKICHKITEPEHSEGDVMKKNRCFRVIFLRVFRRITRCTIVIAFIFGSQRGLYEVVSMYEFQYY
jgi:hypothetical protein